MALFSLIASHQNVDLTAVAQLSAGVDALGDALFDSEELTGHVTLSTCNRLEIYAETSGPADQVEAPVRELLRRLSEQSSLDVEQVAESTELLIEDQAAEHLFAVVAGLDSAVIGEKEIAGQARRALMEAQQRGTATPELVRLFQQAARAGRTVGRRTSLGSRGRSIVSVALDLAEEVAALPWAGCRALVFGTGAYAGAAMAALSSRGCEDLLVWSYSQRAEEFAAKRGGRPVAEDQLFAAMASADVIIGCSGSGDPLPAEALPQGHKVIIDLALSRDFDPNVADLPGVQLITLESVRMAAPDETVESLRAAQQIVRESAQQFHTKRRERSVDAAIVALRRHTAGILEEEMGKVRQQYGCGARADQVEFAMRRMMNSLLHTPMLRAKELAAQGREEEVFDALEALYGLSPQSTREEQAEDRRRAPREEPRETRGRGEDPSVRRTG